MVVLSFSLIVGCSARREDPKAGAQGGDDGSADGDGDERPGEAGLEELVPQVGQGEQFGGDDDDRGADRRAVLWWRSWQASFPMG
jgi:hypothetical protein